MVRVRVLLAFSCLPIVCSANPQSAFYLWPVIEQYDTNCSYVYTLAISASEMTYIVSGGALNSTNSTQLLIRHS